MRCAICAEHYGEADPEQADVIVPLGGDGFMLETLHRFVGTGKPIFGMHRGSVGFLMNSYRIDGLYERLAAAQPVELHPLEMTRAAGERHRAPRHRLQRGLAAARDPAGGQTAGHASTMSSGSKS